MIIETMKNTQANISSITADSITSIVSLPSKVKSTKFVVFNDKVYVGSEDYNEENTGTSAYLHIFDLTGSLINSIPVSKYNGSHISDLRVIDNSLYFMAVSGDEHGAKIQLCKLTTDEDFSILSEEPTSYISDVALLVKFNAQIWVMGTIAGEGFVRAYLFNGDKLEPKVDIPVTDDFSQNYKYEMISSGEYIYISFEEHYDFFDGGVLKFNPETFEYTRLFSGSCHSLFGSTSSDHGIMFTCMNDNYSQQYYYTNDFGITPRTLINEEVFSIRFVGEYIVYVRANGEVHKIHPLTHHDDIIGNLPEFDKVTCVEVI
jgi:WD40 repeat protein